MPIYAYKCSSCGYAKDVLQKLSDAPLTDCPECGASAFSKQVTAAGFQLKGSGWYVTDFRNNGSAPAAKKDGAAAPAGGDSAAKADTAKPDTPKADAPKAGATPAAPAAAPPAAAST